MNRRMTAALAGLLMAGTTACDDVIAPTNGSGEVRVTVQGDAPDAQGDVVPSGADGYRASHSGQAEIDVTARVYVRTRAGDWVEVTRGAAERTVRADAEDGAHLLAAAELSAGTYDRVRVEFDRVTANVGTEIRIGTGLLHGHVRVELGSDGSTVVERELVLEAVARSSSEIRIDLNAGRWLQRADAGTNAVAEADFRSAVTVSIE